MGGGYESDEQNNVYGLNRCGQRRGGEGTNVENELRRLPRGLIRPNLLVKLCYNKLLPLLMGGRHPFRQPGAKGARMKATQRLTSVVATSSRRAAVGVRVPGCAASMARIMSSSRATTCAPPTDPDQVVTLSANCRFRRNRQLHRPKPCCQPSRLCSPNRERQRLCGMVACRSVLDLFEMCLGNSERAKTSDEVTAACLRRRNKPDARLARTIARCTQRRNRVAWPLGAASRVVTWIGATAAHVCVYSHAFWPV